jgi:hypothetical protein
MQKEGYRAAARKVIQGGDVVKTGNAVHAVAQSNCLISVKPGIDSRDWLATSIWQAGIPSSRGLVIRQPRIYRAETF